jgi:hypothetical protein
MTSGRAFVTAALVALVMLPFSAEAKNNNTSKAAKGNGNGPAFCRSGEGHPVHGRQWCRDKGWDVSGTSVFDLGRARDRERERDDRAREDREREDRERDREREERNRTRNRFPWPLPF